LIILAVESFLHGKSLGNRRWATVETYQANLINIKASRTNMHHSVQMKNYLTVADNSARKAEEYRQKAHAAADPRVKSALEAVAREFMRRAHDIDKAAPRLVDIQ
jgi:hypothetical protein